MDDFTQSIKINSNNPDTYFNRGIAFENLGITDQAILDFEKVLKLAIDPNLITRAEKELLKLKESDLQ